MGQISQQQEIYDQIISLTVSCCLFFLSFSLTIFLSAKSSFDTLLKLQEVAYHGAFIVGLANS